MSKLSDGEENLSFQLKAAGIPFEREYRFYPPRRFRFDFVIKPTDERGVPSNLLLAVEVEGGAFSGGHKRGADYHSDCEKHNLAMLDGWRTLRVTPTMVETGEALVWIEKALGKDL